MEAHVESSSDARARDQHRQDRPPPDGGGVGVGPARRRHDVYRNTAKPGVITVPRHRTLSPGVARSVARSAGWL
ncbi:MAG: type II toxin-antitoxin system HicA family toxin [Microvirga sp.]